MSFLNWICFRSGVLLGILWKSVKATATFVYGEGPLAMAGQFPRHMFFANVNNLIYTVISWTPVFLSDLHGRNDQEAA